MTSDRRIVGALSALAAAALIASGCSSTATESETAASSAASSPVGANGCPTMSNTPAWYGDNADRINAMLATYGSCAGHPASTTVGGTAPLALFDWDNTVVRNDIGNATFYWMVSHDKVKRPAAWALTSPYLTPQAQAALSTACDGAAAVGEALPTSRTPKCADELLAIYGDSETTDGAEAFAGFNHREMEPAYAWLAQLFAGWSTAEVDEFATAARHHALETPEGTEETIGTTKVEGWVRYYDQVKNLITALRANGFDVRIISASPQQIVRIWGKELGFTDDKAMGIESVVTDGRYTATLPGCGGRPDNSVITYIDGKRCRVNSEILGISGAAAFDQAPANRRQVFAAGDSDTDMTFVGDATGLRLAINRNKTGLMCRAYFDADDKWIINPMFIDPEPAADDEYKCSTEGDIDTTGADKPLVVDGKTVPDQKDTVHS